MSASGARAFVRVACTALLAGQFAAPQPCDAAAGRWKPEQNVEIVIPTSPGTGSDATGPMSPNPRTRVPLVQIATLRPIEVNRPAICGYSAIAVHTRATPGV